MKVISIVLGTSKKDECYRWSETYYNQWINKEEVNTEGGDPRLSMLHLNKYLAECSIMTKRSSLLLCSTLFKLHCVAVLCHTVLNGSSLHTVVKIQTRTRYTGQKYTMCCAEVNYSCNYY